MTDKKSNDSRRKLLKSIAAGSSAVVAGKALPESWSKPVIDSVMLPVHAATTNGDELPTNCGPFCATQSENNFIGITIDGTNVTIRACTTEDGVLAINASGPLSNGSFNLETNVGNWVNGSIDSDCSGASVQFCDDQAGSKCGPVIPLSPGTCGICDD
jgi:hypothetical protein